MREMHRYTDLVRQEGIDESERPSAEQARVLQRPRLGHARPGDRLDCGRPRQSAGRPPHRGRRPARGRWRVGRRHLGRGAAIFESRPGNDLRRRRPGGGRSANPSSSAMAESGLSRTREMTQAGPARNFRGQLVRFRSCPSASRSVLALCVSCISGGPRQSSAAPDNDPKPGVDWPSFRGIRGAGTSDGFPTATTWNVPDKERRGWSAAVAGLGHSSPVIWGNRLCVTTAISGKTDAGLRIGLYGDIASVNDATSHTWKLLCYDKKTGRTLVDKTILSGVPKVKRHTKSTHANSTLATDGTRLIAMLGSEGLLRVRHERQGTVDEGFRRARFRLLHGAGGAVGVRELARHPRRQGRHSGGRAEGIVHRRVRRGDGQGAVAHAAAGRADVEHAGRSSGRRQAADPRQRLEAHRRLRPGDRQGNLEAERRRRHSRARAGGRPRPRVHHERARTEARPIYAIRETATGDISLAGRRDDERPHRVERAARRRVPHFARALQGPALRDARTTA